VGITKKEEEEKGNKISVNNYCMALLEEALFV
jgi:hypothetical protein